MSAQADLDWQPGQDSRYLACWRHEGTLSRMDYEQALDYAEACEDCTVEHKDPPPVIEGQTELFDAPPAPQLRAVDDVVAPILEAEPDDVAAETYPLCPDCGLEVFNPAQHICAATAAVTQPESAPEPPDSAPVAANSPIPGPPTQQSTAMAEEALFDEGEYRASPTVNLRARFTEPPFTVLNRKAGTWAERDRRWKALGIQSELGRDGDLVDGWSALNKGSDFNDGQFDGFTATSIFSPTLAELAVRWYSAPDAHILDPFAGGSVRGLVASILGRHYTGIELRDDQVEANRGQAHISDGPHPPTWIAGDSTNMDQLLPDGATYDMIFSCPPYTYLEEYSDDPRDLSSLTYPAFLEAYQRIIDAAVARLRQDRYVVWVVGEVREKDGHHCLGLVPDTIKAFQAAGCALYNDHIILTPIGTAAVRTPKSFNASRKAGRVHEYMLVFAKGDGKRAARWAAAQEGPL